MVWLEYCLVWCQFAWHCIRDATFCPCPCIILVCIIIYMQIWGRTWTLMICNMARLMPVCMTLHPWCYILSMSLHDFIVYNKHVNISWTWTGTICSMAFVCGEYFSVNHCTQSFGGNTLLSAGQYVFAKTPPPPTPPPKRGLLIMNVTRLLTLMIVFCSLKAPSPLPYPIVKGAFPLCSDRLQTAFCHPIAEVIALP